MIGLCRKGLDYDGEAMWFRVERDTSRRLAALSCIIERETRRSRISSLRHGRSAEYGQGEGDTVCESERHKGTLLLCITDMRVISGYFFCRLWRAVRTRGVGGGSTREEEYIVVGVEIGMGFVEVGGVWSWGRVGRYGYIKNHKKTIKNKQAQTQERKSEQKSEAKPGKVKPSVKVVKSWSTKVNKTQNIPFKPINFQKNP
ncbi:hypothetical protein Tco_0878586 [Tanacetum coccineum]|uniref:Uncharacterized protein n=1 Tax=Tanacetum coccineum TaxID=301880 RepID=A0ABQ5BYL4_9ASTR